MDRCNLPQTQKSRKILPWFVGILSVIVISSGIFALQQTTGGESIPTKTNMEMVFVPAGEFLMGDDDLDRNMRPQHKVYLDAYWIDQTEVTNKQYRTCIMDGGCRGDEPTHYVYDDSKEDHPVVYVTWQNAYDFCDWAGKTLPTEAQWEKAARGTEGIKFPWGNSTPTLSHGNFDQYAEGTKPVGSYSLGASPYGALDMAGNVFEWTKDWYQWDYYKESPYRNPQGPADGFARVKRGGAWGSFFNSSEFILRTGFRKYTGSEKSYHLGFRCVYEVK